MSTIPEDLLYTNEHEYVRKTSDPTVVQVGVTDYAQGELGDVVYLDLPKTGVAFGGGDSFGTIEAVKAVSDLYAPLAGTVVEVNGALESDPGLVNRDPYGGGWMIKLRVKDPADLKTLLGSAAYKQHIGE
ncbi:MAG TPA: glycine cleavage system protein GcvH [Gemmatimonadales bacterium]|nr:glycine cleavage system protein GcvH [Gemmatimonadales bacterium]